MTTPSPANAINIVVLDGFTLNPGDNPWDDIARRGDLTVHGRTGREQLLERACEADILLTNKTGLDAATLAALPRLRYISVLATGFNVVDVAAAGRLGIPVSNVPEYATATVAQHAFALLLELCNRVGTHNAAVKDGEWTRCPDFSFWQEAPVELAGLTMGVVGFGRIGRSVAGIARAFGMRVIAHTPHPPVTADDPHVRFVPLADLFATADAISLHCPQTAENAGFVDAGLLAAMKPSAFLINTARGGLINERDLAEALNSGKLGGAALDVVSVEPISAGNPLLAARNCLITPHQAWASLAARKRLMAQTAANIAAFIEGHPVNLVNAGHLGR